MKFFENVPTQLDDLQSLYAISMTASQTQNLKDLWGPLLDKALSALKVDAGTMMVLEGGFLVRKTARGLGENIMAEPPLPANEGGVSWKAVLTRQPVVISDITKERIASHNLAEQGFHSLVTMPMLFRDQVIGVMSIFTRKERQFSTQDLNFFSIIANQAALAIISLQSAEILRENRRRLAELEALNQISRSLTTLFDFEETLKSMIESITHTMRSDKGVLLLFDHKDHLLKAVSPAFGLAQIQVTDFRTRNDEGVGGQSFCKGIPIMLGSIDPVTIEVLRRAHIPDVKSVLAAPLKVKSQTLGVLLVFSSRQNNYRLDDLRLFTILSSQAAVVVNSSSMYQQIEEERKKDEALLGSMSDGVLAIDPGQKIIHFNRAGEKITGYLSEELLSKTIGETIGIYSDKNQLLQGGHSPVTRVLQTGKSESSKEYFLRRRHGGFFAAYLSVAAIYNVDDQIVGAIVVFRDITEEQELERMKQEILSLATHELRQPITCIKGYISMILEGDTGGVNDKTREMLGEVERVNQRLADLVDDLLNVSRLEQGRINIRIENFDINELIEQAIKNYQPVAKAKKLSLNFQKKPLPQVKADKTRTLQIITNLISNACKYTFTGSVTIDAYAQGKELICEVSDTGIGIPIDAQKKLFEKFYRVKDAKAQDVTGSGLGLWIVRELLGLMSGRIWFESEENKGSTFYFSLPIAGE